MNAPLYMLGSSLSLEDQEEAKRRFVHRYTGDFTPAFVEACKPSEKHRGVGYKMMFASDEEWLANTEFRVTVKGRLSRKCVHCHSRPTWPNNPELRR